MEKQSVKQLFARIDEHFQQLTKQEKRAVEYIQAHPEEIIHLSITDLALKADVSESTITRLCVKLRYGKFQQMKIAIAQEMVDSQYKIHEDLKPGDTTGQIVEKVFNSSIRAVAMTKAIVDVSEIERCVNAVVNARRIVVVGSGNSGAIALDAQHKFLRLGLDAQAYTDGHMQMIAISALGPEDVVFGISHSGSSIGIRDALSFAKETGAVTVSITSKGSSPVSKVADIHLFTQAQEIKYRMYAISSRSAVLALIDTIYTAAALRKGEEAIGNFDRLEKALTVMKF